MPGNISKNLYFLVRLPRGISIKDANGRNIDVNFSWIKNNDGIIRLVTAIPTKK